MRTPLAVIAALLVVLLAVGFATEGGGESAPAAGAAPVGVIARRVQALRHLRFEAIPKPVRVTGAQARREGLADLDRQYPPARRHADEAIYKLLGLIDPDADLRSLTGSLFERGVAGYYDPRDGRLRVVTESGTGTRVLAEMTLAHELTHALEDQRFGFSDERAATDDRTLAHTALIEGSATWLMAAYAERHFSRDETLGSLLGSAFQDPGDLPPFLQAQVLFPYLDGETFVADLLERARGHWDLVNTAYRLRMPASTEQILHPDAYLEADAPKPVRLRVGAVLGPGWRRAVGGTWGELQTRELLARGGAGAVAAAAGWGGDRYELWQADGRDVLVMRWRWDTPPDEAEFARALRDVDVRGPHAVVRRGGAVTLVVGPDAGTVRRLAGV